MVDSQPSSTDQRIWGLFGGSFDPVHIGHVETAQSVLQQLKLDKLIFLPAARSPFKQQTNTSEQQRLKMLELAIEGESQLEVDAREFGRPPPSYTVDTLKNLHTDYPNQQWVLIMGLDAWQGFKRWHRPERILELVNIVVMTRPGYARATEGNLGLAVDSTEDLFKHRSGAVLHLTVPSLAISSSQLRQNISAGKAYSQWLSPEVAAYVEENDLYLE